MFTGIVEKIGHIRSITPNAGGIRLEIESQDILDGAKIGDSIAVNGCCLTITNLGNGYWTADVVPETMNRTSLGSLAPKDPVNLERALRFNDRLGGHLMQGHVDGIGTIREKIPQTDGSMLVSISAPINILKYIVEKGSIAVDGTSLTVAAVTLDGFEFAMVPHTAEVTVLGCKGIGSHVNLEVDLIAKYVEQLTRRKDELS